MRLPVTKFTFGLFYRPIRRFDSPNSHSRRESWQQRSASPRPRSSASSPRRPTSAVFDELRELICRELTKRGSPEEFVIPDLLKLKVKKVKATKAGTYINRFTGEEKQREAKPASKKVRATPLKKLKDLVNG